MNYEEIKKVCENVAIWDVETIEWSDVRDLIDIIEKQKGVIDEMMTCISMGRKGCCGDHYVYVMQISEKTVGLWREALGPTE